MHAFPDASIPVVQLSINADKPLEYHFQLGAKLAPLRRQGVLVVGSGNVVHNLGAMSWDLGGVGFDWAARIDDDAKAFMLSNPSEALRLDGHRDFRAAVPTRTTSSPCSTSPGWPKVLLTKSTYSPMATPMGPCP